MSKTYKGHPFMIFKMLKPFLFVLIIPVIKGVVQYLLYGRVSGIIGLEILAIAGILAIAILRWLSFSFEINNDIIMIRYGFIYSRISVINISEISSVSFNRNPADYILGSVTCNVNTEAGAIGKPDFEFKLSRKNSIEVSDRLFGKQIKTNIKFSLFKIAIMAATTSSAVTGLIVGVPIIKQAGNLLGIALSDMLFNEINHVSESIQTYFPPAVNTVTIIFFVGYFISFVFSLFRYINFKLIISKEKIEVNSGLFVKRHTAFKKNSVNNIFVEQTPLMRLFHRFCIRAGVGGYGGNKNDKSVIIPCERSGDIKEHLKAIFPIFTPDGNIIRPSRSRVIRVRFFYIPCILAIVTIVLSFILVRVFSYFDRFIIFLTFIVMGAICYYADLCLLNYRTGKIRFGDIIYARNSKGLNSCELYCEKERIGIIKIIRYPADFYYGTCRVKIVVRSEGAQAMTVRNLDYKSVKENICKTFNVEY